MKIKYQNGKFVAESRYEEKDILKEAGFRWDPDYRRWWTDDPDKAVKLSGFADETAVVALTSIIKAREKALVESRATNTDIDIPKPDGLEYLPYQKAGIAYVLNKFGIEVFPKTHYNTDKEKSDAKRRLPTQESETERIGNQQFPQGSLTGGKTESVCQNQVHTVFSGVEREGQAPDERNNEQTRCEKKAFVGPQEVYVRERSVFQEWERTRTGGGGAGSEKSIVSDGVRGGISCKNERILSPENTSIVQSGLCISGEKDSYRAGRTTTQANQNTGTGQKEDGNTTVTGMDSYPNFSPYHSVLIGDEPGLGKTIQSIGIINSDWGIKNVLLIVPATLKLNWQKELLKWLTRPLPIAIVKDNIPDTGIVILNYDILSKFNEGIHSREWDLLIADESHKLKNPNAQRTQMVFGKWDRDPAKVLPEIRAKRKLFLTGTPILNRPVELWPLLQNLGIFKSWKQYVTRYCDAYEDKYGWNTSGASHLEELQDKLRSTVMVRRLKKDVAKEIPPKRRQVIELAANGASNAIRQEMDIMASHEAKLADLQAEMELAKAGTDEEYRNAVKALREATLVAFTEMARVRHETAMAKLPQVIEHLRDLLENDKVVVFAHHHDVVNGIMAEFGDVAVKLTGEEKLEDRQSAVDRFQNDPNVRLFVGSITAAGVGITLTAASTVVFAELDWVPGNITQAEDRLHRIGQVNPVLIQHLVLEGSLDSKMAKTLVAKQEVIDQALDIESAREPILPLAPVVEASRKVVVEEGEKITPEEIAEVHRKLRVLAGMCDGAVAIDNVGFNKMDSALGKRLAGLLVLTARQAVLGRYMLKKYWRHVK